MNFDFRIGLQPPSRLRTKQKRFYPSQLRTVKHVKPAKRAKRSRHREVHYYRPQPLGAHTLASPHQLDHYIVPALEIPNYAPEILF
jgi:hypothetical protein